VSIELNKSVKVAVLAHLGEVGVLNVCQRTLHFGRGRRTDNNHRSDIELKTTSNLSVFWIEELEQLRLELAETIQFRLRELIFRYEVRFAL
jgi:hypothetical protein